MQFTASTACSEVSALGTQEENDSKSFVPSEPSFDQKLIPPIIRMPTVAWYVHYYIKAILYILISCIIPPARVKISI